MDHDGLSLHTGGWDTDTVVFVGDRRTMTPTGGEGD